MGAIEVHGMGKRYLKLDERATLLTTVVPFLRQTKSEHWALRDVSFEVQPGETVGILGRNGAGKTTMLRLLAGVSRPSEGVLTVRGRVAPLISVGVGFHQEMTGRENVFVNGMLLGLTKRQVTERFDEIVAFAELEEYIDTPVKFYSTGMYMRLGFAVAAHVDPEVLLVDEILAVGDIAFQLKSFERMRALQQQGTTIVLVSHSMHAIRALCPRALLIRRGRLEIDGTSEDAIAMHHRFMSAEGSEGDGETMGTFLRRELIGADGPAHNADKDSKVTYVTDVRFEESVHAPYVEFEVRSEDGTHVYTIISVLGREGSSYHAGDVVTIEVPFVVRLGAGTFRLRVTIMDRFGRRTVAYDSAGFLMYVPPTEGVSGVADLNGAIYLEGERISDYDKLLLSSAPRPSSMAESLDET